MSILKVNVKDYYPNADYISHMERGEVITKPKDSKYEIGMLMYDKVNNSIGMILGCIDEACGELRLDSDGMQPIDNLRYATKSDFDIEDLRYKMKLNLV